MPSLAELERQFADAIFAPPGTAPSFALADGGDGAERIGIYRNAIFANYRGALAESYPVVQRLVGAAFFGAAVEAFVRAHPSTSGDLGVYGDSFGDFLRDYPHAAELPYLGDVARLEWAVDEAKRAADARSDPDAVLAALAGLAPERLPETRLVLDPSCRFVASDYPVLRIWQLNQPDCPGDERVDLDESADRLLVRRTAEGVAIAALAPAADAFLRVASAEGIGAAIDAAQGLDAAFDLRATLGGNIAAGVIVGVTDE